MALLTAEKLTLGYERNILVSDLSFSVSSGDRLLIVGENGSGKTTLMRTILDLQKPLSGRIVFADGLTPKSIGYLPQQSAHLRDFPASVAEIVLSGCLSHLGGKPFYGKAERMTAEANMERTGVSALSSRRFRELSGGQQQRVMLARALCASEKLLLLDEPISGLDPKAASAMYDTIAELNGSGMTVIEISHDIASALHGANMILHLGAWFYFGTVQEYLNSDAGKRFLASGRGDKADD